GTAAPCERAVLRGVAPQPGRRARACRDLQRRPERHAVGRSRAKGLVDADRDARAGRRQSGVVRRQGARRNRPRALKARRSLFSSGVGYVAVVERFGFPATSRVVARWLWRFEEVESPWNTKC